jgi:AraC-like DNA-binding protein
MKPRFASERGTMTEDTTRQVLPTAIGFVARQAIGALRKRNVAVEPLLQRVGLSERDFDNQRRISAIAQSKFLEYAAEALGDSAFGLHLAQQTNPREAKLLFYVTSAAKNVGETIALYMRYCRIVNEAVRVKLLQAPDGMIVEFDFVGLSRHHARQSVEFTVAVTLKGLRELLGRGIRPTRVAFAHTRNSHLREFERFFGSPVEFGAPSDQVSVSNQTLALPLVTGDPHLLETLQPFCDVAARERHTPAETLRASVENEVQKLLPNRTADRGTIARALGMSERTLSRKLADEGATYEEVVDQLRRSLALQYIKEPGLSVSQIAWLLGYEGSTSFNHAFRRWTGNSPSIARSENQLRASAQPQAPSVGRSRSGKRPHKGTGQTD